MRGIRFHERVLVVGETESGKSALVNWLASEFECQILLVDTKGHEWTIEGVEPVYHVSEIDWSERVIHYVTTSTEVEEIEELFAVLNTRSDIVVVVHEMNDLSAYHTQKTPEHVNRYLAQGGAKGRGLIGATQLPVDMAKRARTEAQHVILTVPPISDQHLAVLAGVIGGISVQELRAELEECERIHGPYSFMHFPMGARNEPTRFPPLPPAALEQSLIQPLRVHASQRRGSEGREDVEVEEEAEPE